MGEPCHTLSVVMVVSAALGFAGKWKPCRTLSDVMVVSAALGFAGKWKSCRTLFDNEGLDEKD